MKDNMKIPCGVADSDFGEMKMTMKKTARLVLSLAALAGCENLGIGFGDGQDAAPAPRPFRAATFNMRTDCTADRGRHDWTNRVPLIEIGRAHV